MGNSETEREGLDFYGAATSVEGLSLRERNNRLFKQVSRTPEQIVCKVRDETRLKLFGLEKVGDDEVKRKIDDSWGLGCFTC
ncbi:hypothetical protein PTKIN_Ptkin15bG0188200 [Pterospermum kingtungense]